MHDRRIRVPDEVAGRLDAALREGALDPDVRQVYQELLDSRDRAGRVTVFGNQGWLYRNAMTWWDHGTGSVWTQVWGRALMGPLRGTTLEVIPASLVPWRTWRAEHPETLALDEPGPRGLFRERPRDRFVIGVTLAGEARGYRFTDVRDARVVNDAVGAHPVLVYVDPQTRQISVFFRRLGERVLTFAWRAGRLIDEETGSAWQPERGLATAGPLKGEALKPLAYIPAYEQAWMDFYPHTSWYLRGR